MATLAHTSLLSRQIAALRAAMAEPTPLKLEEVLIFRSLAGQPMRPMQPPPGVAPRTAAVLLLFYPSAEELWVPLTLRSARLTTHRGEVSLPGGGCDQHDDGPVATALREAWEELAINPDHVEVLGTLTSFYVAPSNNCLTPVVGLNRGTPTIRPDPDEVEAAFSVPLRMLLDPQTVGEEVWEMRGQQVRVPFFLLEGYKVWGATALLLSELVVRLRRVGLSF